MLRRDACSRSRPTRWNGPGTTSATRSRRGTATSWCRCSCTSRSGRARCTSSGRRACCGRSGRSTARSTRCRGRVAARCGRAVVDLLRAARVDTRPARAHVLVHAAGCRGTAAWSTPTCYGGRREPAGAGRGRGSVHNYFQLADVDRYLKMMESRLVLAVSRMMRAAGYSPASFDEQAATVVNNNVQIGGSVGGNVVVGSRQQGRRHTVDRRRADRNRMSGMGSRNKISVGGNVGGNFVVGNGNVVGAAPPARPARRGAEPRRGYTPAARVRRGHRRVRPARRRRQGRTRSSGWTRSSGEVVADLGVDGRRTRRATSRATPRCCSCRSASTRRGCCRA